MSYQVHTNSTGGYDIFESTTDTTIVLGAVETRARNICRKMNLGSGFNGWTPDFITVRYPLTVTEE